MLPCYSLENATIYVTIISKPIREKVLHTFCMLNEVNSHEWQWWEKERCGWKGRVYQKADNTPSYLQLIKIKQ